MILERLSLAFATIILLPSGAFAANAYLQHNLVSDLPNMAERVDPGLVNPWGIAASATGPFWISDNGSGLSTLYNSAGVINALKVTIPVSGTSGSGSPTGIVFNGTTGFTLDTGRPSSFIFATEDGTISGWNSAFDGTHAIVKVNNSGAVYKGLALGANLSGPLLYAANFNSGQIDVFGPDFAPVKLANTFSDAMIPGGFAPFNIQNLGGKLYVTYARQDAAKHDDVAGRGNGYVNVFDMNGALLQRLVSAAPLNSPWGLAIAPANFGDFSNALLVGNFGDGAINAFNVSTGASLGALRDVKGAAVSINGLWGLFTGNGGNGGDANAVYFTAGIAGPDSRESHGLFGSLQAAPVIASSSVVNGASFQPGIASNTWISIVGGNLSATTRSWQASDFSGNKLPTVLDGVSVTVNGKPAYVYFVSPKQINVLTPVDNTLGPVQIAITNNGLASGSVSAQLQNAAPAFFLINSDKYVAATHANGSLIGPTTLISGATTPAKSGEVVVLYGTGFGPTNPAIADGQTVTAPATLTAIPVIKFGGVPGQVMFAGLTAPGLYQFNVKIPDGFPDGDLPVSAEVGGLRSQDVATITIQQ